MMAPPPRSSPVLAGLALALALALVAGPAPATAQEAVTLSADAQDAFFRGVGLLEAGDAAAALGAFDEAASLQPDFRRVYYYRARALVDLGRLDEAGRSLTAYERFDLPDAEAFQAQELRDALNAAAAPAPQDPDPATEPEPAAPQVPEPAPAAPADPTAGADAELADAARALEDGRCAEALLASQRAMRLDPGRVRVFLLKGLALECAGELGRARSVLVTYMELAPEPEATAAAALDRITAQLQPHVASPAPRSEPRAAEAPAPKTLGRDPRIAGVLDQRFGEPEPNKGATVLVPGVGAARYKSLRLDLAGFRSQGEQLALWQRDQLVWARARVDEGGDALWFGRAFDELVAQVAQDSGDPVMLRREGSPAEALAGRARYEAVWTDGDNDRLRLRLGRCARRDDNAAVMPATAPCLELTGSAGSWTPAERVTETLETAAAALARTPGDRAFDFSVGLGGGGGFGLLIERFNGAASVAPEAGADLLVRFSIGAFVGAFASAPSVAGYGGNINAGPFFESRLQGYVGLRAGHRQPHNVDLMLGFGLLPQINAFGLPDAAPTLSLRIVDNRRRAPMGLVWVSFEPWVMISALEVRVVPMRFTVGGAVSTRARLRGAQRPDSAWGPLFPVR